MGPLIGLASSVLSSVLHHTGVCVMRRHSIDHGASPLLFAAGSPPLEPWEQRASERSPSKSSMGRRKSMELPPPLQLPPLVRPMTATSRLSSNVQNSRVRRYMRRFVLVVVGLFTLISFRNGVDVSSIWRLLVQSVRKATLSLRFLALAPLVTGLAFAISLLVNVYGGRCRLPHEVVKGKQPARWGKTAVACVVNPVGGRKRGRAVGASLLALLHKAGIAATSVETTHAGHAQEIAASLERAAHRTKARAQQVAVCVGGDGLLSEMLNGMAFSDSVYPRLPIKTPLAIVAEGTGNGFATSIGIRSGEDAATALVCGSPRATDLLELVQKNEGGAVLRHRMAHLSVGWGTMAEIDRLAEVELRCLGWLRCHLAPLKAIFDNKRVEATLWHRDCCRGEGEWRCLEGHFALVHACNVAWVAHDVQLAPGAEMDDGCMTVVLL